MISYAQNFEDVLLVRCFGKVSDGFYVETNACHPMIAPSAKLFYDPGWCGINLEAGTCIDALREAGPRDNNLAIAITDAEGKPDSGTTFRSRESRPSSPEVAENVAEKARACIIKGQPTLSLAHLAERHADDRHTDFFCRPFCAMHKSTPLRV